MKLASGPEKCLAIIAGYISHHQNRRNAAIHCICALAIIFSIIGILTAINFGIALITIAASIIYYNRLGHKTAMQMAAFFIVMVTMWITIMPARHLIASAIGIFILAWIGLFTRHIQAGSKPSFVEDLQYLPAAPLYAIAELNGKLSSN